MTQGNGRGAPRGARPATAEHEREATPPPQNVAAEESVLGALMLAGNDGVDGTRRTVATVLATGLDRGSFYRASHGLIFAACLALDSRREPCDVLLVVRELEREGVLGEVGGQARVYELAALVPAASNAAHYARLVVDAARRREQFLTARALEAASLNGGLDGHPDIANRLGRLLTPWSTSETVRTFAELLEQYAAERGSEDAEPVRLGFGTIDAELRGVSAGQVLGVAARAGVGKTWVLNSVIETYSARRDAGALQLSLEMPGPEWAERQLAIHAGVAPERVEEWAREGVLLERAESFLDRMRHMLVFDGPARLDEVPRLLATARRRLDVPLRLLAIDYLGLLGATGKDAYERASALGKGLKLLAKEEHVSVIVAMQVNRAAGDGSSPVTIEMLRDSGVLEESLDFLLGAWRPEKAQTLSPDEREQVRDIVRVAILKNRKGGDGRVVDLHFDAHSRRVYEPVRLPFS